MSWEKSKQMVLQYKAAKETLKLDPTNEEARRLRNAAADWIGIPARLYRQDDGGVEAP